MRKKIIFLQRVLLALLIVRVVEAQIGSISWFGSEIEYPNAKFAKLFKF